MKKAWPSFGLQKQHRASPCRALSVENPGKSSSELQVDVCLFLLCNCHTVITVLEMECILKMKTESQLFCSTPEIQICHPEWWLLAYNKALSYISCLGNCQRKRITLLFLHHVCTMCFGCLVLPELCCCIVTRLRDSEFAITVPSGITILCYLSTENLHLVHQLIKQQCTNIELIIMILFL